MNMVAFYAPLNHWNAIKFYWMFLLGSLDMNLIKEYKNRDVNAFTKTFQVKQKCDLAQENII